MTAQPKILGNVVLSNGDLAVLAGNTAKNGTYYGFDDLQIAILASSTPVTLNQTSGNINFPSGDSPSGSFPGDAGIPGSATQGGATIAALPGGGMAIMGWGDSNLNYTLQILNNAGTVTTQPFVVHSQFTTAGNNQTNAANPQGAVAAWSGGLVVAYSTDNLSKDYYQRYTLAGVAVGSPVLFASTPDGTGTGWQGSMAVDSSGDVIFGFGTADVFTLGAYKMFSSSNAVLNTHDSVGKDATTGATAVANQGGQAPTFVPLPGGGFATVGYSAVGAYNASAGNFPSFTMNVQTVSTAGAITTRDTVTHAVEDNYYQTAYVNWISVLPDGTVEFQEIKDNSYYHDTNVADSYTVGGALSRGTVSLPLPDGDTSFAVPPATGGENNVVGVIVNASNQLVGEGISAVVCFAAGTHIATPTGEVPVEQLQIGDLVLTAHNLSRPVRWIGQGKVLATRGRRSAATPVIVRKGALADNVPNRDLRVTKAHALYIDDVLIPVEFLVNHRTILWDDRAQEVAIYHVELDSHDVLLANGAPAESYRDDGNRWLFRNASADWHLPPQAPCAPVLTGGPVVDAVWRRLLDRAGPRALPPLTADPDLHLVVDGVRVDAQERQGSVYVFRLPPRPNSVVIASREAVPAELGIARDPRSLGVALRRVAVRQGTKFMLFDAGDDRLTVGFHAYEADSHLRWTDGCAELPAASFARFDKGAEVVLHLGGVTQYRDERASPARAAA
jgi:hypothetical protein